jgi:four helix bundle protein
MSDKQNILLDKSLEFAIRVGHLYRQLSEKKKEFVLSKQLLRSGTAIGAMTRETQNGESKADFIHKLSITQKECDETIYGLILLRETSYLSETEFKSTHADALGLLKIIRSIILTTKTKLKPVTIANS